MKIRFSSKTPCLPADIYRSDYGDGSKNGVSKRSKTVDCHYKAERTSAPDSLSLNTRGCEALGYSQIEARNLANDLAKQGFNDDFIIVQDMCYGIRLRAIPVSLIVSGKWTMFGGNFVWTGDSRFFSNPIKINDRAE